MNKIEAWDDLKQWLAKGVTEVYRLGNKQTNTHEELRLKAKANGMDMVLVKMEEYERCFITE